MVDWARGHRAPFFCQGTDILDLRLASLCKSERGFVDSREHGPFLCAVCNAHTETDEHLIFDCVLATEVLRKMMEVIRIASKNNDFFR